jgi:hypothetical protein
MADDLYGSAMTAAKRGRLPSSQDDAGDAGKQATAPMQTNAAAPTSAMHRSGKSPTLRRLRTDRTRKRPRWRRFRATA